MVFAGCSNKLKASLKACGLYRRVGGPLTMHSAEEVYSLLVDAPAHVPGLAHQSTLVNLPPRYYSTYTSAAGSVSVAGGAATVAVPPIREE